MIFDDYDEVDPEYITKYIKAFISAYSKWISIIALENAQLFIKKYDYLFIFIFLFKYE